MSAKDIELDIAACIYVADGMNTLARVALESRGCDVVVEKSWTAATITDEGVMIANELELEEITVPIALHERPKPAA